MKKLLLLALALIFIAALYLWSEKAEAPADGALAKADLIVLTSPAPGATVASPLILTGTARGYWYFEASFPVELRDAKGEIIALVPAEAQSEWMTEEFVPFRAELHFSPQPQGSRGTLRLKKDNPSGDPERDDELVVPVTF